MTTQLYFKGSDRVVVPNLDTTTFSVSVWLNRDDTTRTSLDRVLMSVNSNGWGLLFEADVLHFSKVGVSSVNTTTWVGTGLHHLGFSYDGATAKFYVDGALVASPAYSVTFNSSGGDYTIGSRGTSEYFKGYMTDMRVYDDVLLDADFATIYNAGVPDYADGTTGGAFFAWWKMDEGSAHILGDSSGNARPGAIFGAEWTPLWFPIKGVCKPLPPPPPPWERFRLVAAILDPNAVFVEPPWTPRLRLGNKPAIEQPILPRSKPAQVGGLLQHIDQQARDRIKPHLVPRDPRAPSRTISHEQMVSGILNSLLRRGEIKQTSQETYELGYKAEDHQDWQPGEPTTVAEALDRLAALAKSLNGIGA